MWHLILIIRGFLKKMNKDHVSAYAAQTAYFIMLSFFPFILLLFSLLQYIPVITKEDFLNIIINICPPSFYAPLESILDEIYSKSVAIVSVTAFAAIWSAARGLLSLSHGLNVIYQVEETRNYIIMRFRAALYTLLFLISIILTLLLLVFGNSIQLLITAHLPILAEITAFIIGLRTIITMAVLMIVFLLIYKVLPNRKANFKSQIPGAVITAASWTIFSFGFSFYVDNYGNFTQIYGNLTTVIMVMLWLYFCMYILFTGAQVNAYFEERFRKVRREITAWKESKEKEKEQKHEDGNMEEKEENE